MLSFLLTGRTTGMATPAHKEAEEAAGALSPPPGLGLCYRREQSGWQVGRAEPSLGYGHDGTASAIEELAVPWMSLAGLSTGCVRAVKRDLCPTLGEGAEVPRTRGSRRRGRVAGLPGEDD